MVTIQLFIGSNNTTGAVEVDLIEATLNKHFKGYTIQECTGYWLGSKEDTVAVTITDELEKIDAVTVELKELLKQDAIASVQLPEMRFI